MAKTKECEVAAKEPEAIRSRMEENEAPGGHTKQSATEAAGSPRGRRAAVDAQGPAEAQKGRLVEELRQLFRYGIVGAIAFFVDFAVLAVCKERLLREAGHSLYLATAAGFFAGLAVNYALSVTFVFRSAKETKAGRDAGSIALFAAIGVIGLLLSEAGMHLGAVVLSLHYMAVKVVVAGAVLLWNYFARKLFIFDRKKPKNL